MAYLNLEIEIYPDQENFKRVQISYEIPQSWEGYTTWDLLNNSVIDIPMQFNQGFGDGEIQEAELSQSPSGEVRKFPNPRGYRFCRSGNPKARNFKKPLAIAIF